jgi:DNA-binding phage protein
VSHDDDDDSELMDLDEASMDDVILELLDEAPEVRMTDGTKEKAIQVQVQLTATQLSGALTYYKDKTGLRRSGVYRLLSVGTDPEGKECMVECIVDALSIQSINRLVAASTIIKPS